MKMNKKKILRGEGMGFGDNTFLKDRGMRCEVFMCSLCHHILHTHKLR